MRHGKKFNHLGRKAPHRKAMLENMAVSLIEHKRITTTLAKAKELRKFVEPIITRAKDDTTHSRRMAFSYLQNKEAVKTLFGEVAEKVGARPGGYTRIIKLGQRLGDAAEVAMIELVDFNELLVKEEKPKRSRRSRRGGKGSSSAAASEATEDTAIVEEAVVEEASSEEETSEEPKAEAKEEEAPAAEAATEEAAPEAKAEEAEEAGDEEEKSDDDEEKKSDA